MFIILASGIMYQCYTLRKNFNNVFQILFYSYVDSLSKMTLTSERVAKVVPQRIFSVVLHPGTDQILAACGDEWGHLGLWFVVS
jgi:hypothetical protein